MLIYCSYDIMVSIKMTVMRGNMKESSKKQNNRFAGFLKSITLGLFSRFKKQDETNELYDLFNREDEFSDDAEKANSLCAELMDIADQKINLLKELQEVMKQEKELEQFKLLTAEDMKKIRKLLFDYKAIEDEKESLKGRLISKNRILSVIQKYEDEIPKILNEIKEAEEKQIRVKRDVDYLEGEKEALIYNREQLENAQVLIYRLSIGTVIALGIVALIFAVLIAKETRILIPAVITAIVAIGMGTWIYIFRRQVEYELVKNGRMQARAVKLLNKAKIRYVYYTNFLEYEYKKFNVDSLEQLERNWELYKKNKHHEKRYRSINSTMSKIEDEVLSILENRGIYVRYFDDIKQWSTVEERRKILAELEQEREALESKLDFLDTYQEDIWNQLNELKERDQTEDKIIEKIIQNYLEDMEAKA
ncbi:MAG: hypothetical protein PWP07_1098 [Epulopiscium sp.]|nr:hypothetical protein [Defluviitaleaceae bacterium]MDK2787873.1 hypothetical protein [Candidatus Epulonipiscium sp.]